MRRFGFKVFYGDATRLDLLEAAGAGKAKLLLVALDGVEDKLALVDLARSRFPNLTLVVRARNVRHDMEPAARGVQAIERETFEAALRSRRQVLQALGHEPFEAREPVDVFRRHIVASLAAMQPHFQDVGKMVARSKSGRAGLEESLRRGRASRDARATASGWH